MCVNDTVGQKVRQANDSALVCSDPRDGAGSGEGRKRRLRICIGRPVEKANARHNAYEVAGLERSEHHAIGNRDRPAA